MTTLVIGNSYAATVTYASWVNYGASPNGAASFTVQTGPGVIEAFSGNDISYDQTGRPIAGLIYGWQEKSQGNVGYTISDVNLSISQLLTQNHFTVFIGNDSLAGGMLNDGLAGYNGHDVIVGGAGADVIDGGEGNDHLYGGGMLVTPGDGSDTIIGGYGADYINGNAGNDDIRGDIGTILLGGPPDFPSSRDRLFGGQGNDTISGEYGNDTVNGNLGNDSIHGGVGDDFLQGGQGNDTVEGSLGDDLIMGNKGIDELSGSRELGDRDTFSFNYGDALYETSGAMAYRTDRIVDWERGLDHIHLPFGIPSSLSLAGSFADAATAEAAVLPLLQANSSSTDVVQARIGSELLLFFSSDATNVFEAIRMISTPPLDFSDFI